MKTVESDAEALVAAASKSPIQKFSISKIITSRCPAQMRATLEHYKGRYRHSLGKVIKQETKGNFQVLLRVLMRYAKNPVNYFVKALYKSMKGLGTDDPTLIRIIVMRAEIDMEEIKRSFYLKYSSSLQSMIVSDTSGSYRTFLLSLCGATLSEIQAVSSLKHRFSTRKP
ncbi:hypothetical protein KP509_04G035800 [Ceratopteris richardii]|nr:hypothetical protein KP509_04G035800 [Ceratopteris richardii]